MSTYRAPIKDMLFCMNHLANLDAVARHTDTPRGWPALSLLAKMGLPKLMAARSLPVGASSAVGGGAEGVAQAASKVISANTKPKRVGRVA